jgi:hypothetical protein
MFKPTELVANTPCLGEDVMRRSVPVYHKFFTYVPEKGSVGRRAISKALVKSVAGRRPESERTNVL